VEAKFLVQPCVTAHGPDGTQTTEHESEAADVEPEHSQWIDQEVHCHRVRGVFRATQRRFHQCEASLHKHDDEARDERPHHVDGHFRMAEFRGDFSQSWFARFCGGQRRGATRGTTVRVRHRCVIRLRRPRQSEGHHARHGNDT
jgi:hypothetical protein